MPSASKYPSKSNDQLKAEQDKRIADAQAIADANERVRAQENRRLIEQQMRQR